MIVAELLPNEPTLSEMLADPIVIALMRSDGVTPEALVRLMRKARERLADRHADIRRAA